MNKPGGTFSPFLYYGRMICHYLITLFTIYLLALWGTIIATRNLQKNGDRLSVALRIRNLPFGSVFFQEGLYFDCPICLQGFWANEEIVCLTCSENHVFHPKCLKQYIDAKNTIQCILCQQKIQIAFPEDHERIDNGSLIGAPQSEYTESIAEPA